MTLTDRSEEILESLWIELVEHNKKTCDAGLLRDDEVIKDLIGSGYIDMKDKQINLTRKGREEARGCIRRHRLAERLLTDVFDVKKKLIHETGCKFEHLLHKGLDDNICTLLGHPKNCPHGQPIPEGACCRAAKKISEKLIMPLFELSVKKKAKISYLQTQNYKILQKIIAIGALPKTEIMLLHKFPSYVIRIGKSQFAIDKELASHIYVRIL